MKGLMPAQDNNAADHRNTTVTSDGTSSHSTNVTPQTSHQPLSAVTRNNILQLQKLIGNRAVLRLIQRQDHDDAEPAHDPALTAAQVTAALDWYAAQPERYTPQIIQRIRQQVGRGSATGPLTAEDVQAVARWQIENRIEEHDGRAGTTTLAAMFRFGLSTDAAIGAFAGQGRGLEREWQFLDADQRLARMEQLINNQLAAAGVPHVPTRVDPRLQAAGSMDVFGWRMNISQHVMVQADGGTGARGGLPEIDFGNLINTLYHEARHAEQTFMVARMLAGRGQGAGYIARVLRLVESVAEAATERPLPPGSPEALIAQGWYDAFYGQDSGETSHTYTRVLNALADREHSRDEARQHPGEEANDVLQGAERRLERAEGPYEALPGEADAFRVGDRAEDEYLLPDD